MNIAAHIFKKDVRRFWPLLVIAGAYLTMLTTIAVSRRHSVAFPTLDWTSFFFSNSLLGSGAFWILSMLIIVFLIHEDKHSG
ncbi:MAG: hypothetical protein LAP85_20895 [Acidobacteriia bacterium]|nr:hypothetical protein [Terriglobia bacterium]